MAACPIGTVWAVGSWSDTAWECNTWADRVIPPPVTGQSPRASRYRSMTNTRMVYRFALWLLAIGGLR
jgi:hypothetical protein